MKKKLGIIGGMGPMAGAWLFQRILQLSEVKSDQDHLEIILHNNTLIPDRTRAILNNTTSSLHELIRSTELLKSSQVDVIIMACMTSYYYYNDLLKVSSGKLLHPISFVLKELSKTNYVKIGLIGSSGLLKSGIFQSMLCPFGYEVLTLNEQDQERYFMHPIYNGVKAGAFIEKSKQEFLKQFDILTSRGAEVVIGACSELPLVVNQEELTIHYFDVFELLAKNIVDYCYQYTKWPINTNCSLVE